MMGDAKPTYTKNRHDFLQLVNAAGSVGCRARGAAFGAACTAMRQLGWVEQVPAIGIKVRITDLGTRALQAWDAGQRGDLDLRTGEERQQQVLEDVLDLAEQHQLDERLLRALLQRMPVLAVQRCMRDAVKAAGAFAASVKPMSQAELQEILATFDRYGGGTGMILPNDGEADTEHRFLVDLPQVETAEPVLTRGEAVLPFNHPLVQQMLATPMPADVGTRTITVDVMAKAPSFVPGGYTGDRPAGPAARLTPAVVVDPPAVEDDEDDHGLVICPSCDGRGVSGQLHIDCRMCKGEGAIKRTVPL